MCSAFPNPNALMYANIRLANVPISRNRYFQLRNIEIPIHPGEMRVHTNEFLYVDRISLQRPFLECNCNIKGYGDAHGNICIDGKVYLSKGLCSDMSFFVHTLSPSGNFNVLAHINFLRWF